MSVLFFYIYIYWKKNCGQKKFSYILWPLISYIYQIETYLNLIETQNNATKFISFIIVLKNIALRCLA